MRALRPWILPTLLAAWGLALGACGRPEAPPPAAEEVAPAPSTLELETYAESSETTVPGAIPYTLEFVPQAVPADFPALQAYSFAVLEHTGNLAVLGGRQNQGLHTFKTEGNNFPKDLANQYLWLISLSPPRVIAKLDLKRLDPSLGDPLMATNQQSHYNPDTGDWHILGGYGWDTQTGGMRTFPSLIRWNLRETAELIADSTLGEEERMAALAKEIEQIRDPFFAVTGGVMRKLDGMFVVTFGQLFDGEYNPFGGSRFTQVYTEAIRYFTLKPGPLAVNTKGSLTSSNEDHPYHRRDLPVVVDVDPATGAERIAAFGGVFPPGVIGGYDYPVYVTSRFGALQANPDRSVAQRFSQYECPTIPVWSAGQKTIYHTMFGGISHYHYHFTAKQKEVYDSVTAQGRNDGLPFIPAVSTFLQKADGTYEEYIAPQPIPGNKLHGTSVEFIPIAGKAGGKLSANGVVQLDAFLDGERVQIGWIYGGIEADYPLPVVPNEGSQAVNALYAVYLSKTPWDGIPASDGHKSIGDFNHHPTSG